MNYAQQKLPEPMLATPIRVRLSPDGNDRFAARMSGTADERLAFKHLCLAHGGDRRGDAFSFEYVDFAGFVDHLRESDALIQPAPELWTPLMRTVAALECDLSSLDERCRSMPHEIYPFQLDGAEYLVTHRRAALFDEMGLGKTIQVLAALPNDAAALVVCPASMRLTWAKEGAKWRPDIEWVVAKKTVDIVNPGPGQAIICSPEGLIRATAQLGTPGITLVCDEAHYYKNSDAKRTQAVAQIADRCGRAWICTGTPMTNRPPDLMGVLRTFKLFERAWPTRRYFDIAFGLHFDRETGSIDWPAKPPHPDAIVRSLGRVSIRRTRAEVLPELPAKTYAEVPIDLRDSKVTIPETTKAHRRIYKAVDQGGLEVIKFEEFSGFSDARAALAAAKIPQMLEVIERFREQSTPLVICSCNVAPLEELRKRGFAVIMGDVSPEKRQAAVEAFQDGTEPIIGIQTIAGGTGITLTRAAHMLMVQRDWVPASNVQAEDRIARIGQEASSVVIYDMVANHPLDEIIGRNLRTKQNRIDVTVNRVTHEITSGRKLVARLRELASYIG